MTNRKPALKGEWADPLLLRDGEDYYLYPTKDSQGWLYEKFHVFRSKDLIQWDGPYTALDLNDVGWAKSRAWAPGVNKIKDKYYMYFSAEAQIGVAAGEVLDRGAERRYGVLQVGAGESLRSVLRGQGEGPRH
ncbi:family 43 glycosylhydrolase [Cohnella fermenti]|uniref:Glycosyl hydrolase family 32 N-terminal domain-containing protein n=1 Tax=Cohnella fermenti TaxID=2565925 RepID=A0A4S4C3Z8_9BACL|nr:family 43 glycosylhydrolase [Cohnella fermenti]THF80389.1 hypothetical protein E6C55_10950 [Cohnella fermenti]